MLRNSLLILTSLLALPAFRAAAQSKPDAAGGAAAQAAAIPARITQAIDETQLVRLKGNVHPLARQEFDRGPVSDATPMKRMMLLLQRSPEQQAALSTFMDEQMSNDSPNFHKWLTPDEFGRLYGPADTDTQTVTSWLASHGFTAMRVDRGKTVIEFSGNVGQVRSAFHTDIHKFVVNGEERQANTSDPQIPAALTPVVAGVVSLHNFPMKSAHHVLGQFKRTADGRIEPLFTDPSTPPAFFALGPADFAKIYNIPSSMDGTGGNIAIIGFSSINVQDVRDFRALFALPVNDPVVVNNGPDPGLNGEETEADLDVQWSGAVAPKATIHYINSEGTLTSDPVVMGAEYVVDNNSDDVMSLSFTVCEANFGTFNAFFNSLWEQAAAQGITVTVAAGDAGSAGCDDFNIPAPASGGIAVNGLASTPFNIAVGGTDFDDAGTQNLFWSPTNAPGTRESALGYIHEVPWNSSCAATATSSNLTTCVSPPLNLQNILAGGGGPSILYAKPSFQNGIMPNGIATTDTHRYLPDVSLYAAVNSNSNSFYVICETDAVAGNSCTNSSTFNFIGIGGTSASAPSFAGVIALIGQSEANAGRSRRQGNANLVLYKIAATAANSCDSSATPLIGSTTCAFYNVTKGNNSVPCTGGTPNCSSTSASVVGVLVSPASATTPAFSTIAGTGSIPSYDLATGLGTVNVTNLATAWGTAVGAFKGSTTSLKINGATTTVNITHGTAVTATVTVAAKAPATGTPTGDASVLGPALNPPTQPNTNGGGNGGPLNASGVATISGVILPGGTYNATAHYAGDGTFAASDDPTGVPVVVAKENSVLQYGIVTFDLNTGNLISTNSMNFPYGSPYILRIDILNHTGTATNCQRLTVGGVVSGCAFDATGTVMITDNGSPLDTGTFIINSEGHAEDQPIQLPAGTHALSATYSGDNSYNAPATPTTDNLTVTKAITATSTVPSTSTVTSGTPMTLTANITSQSNSAAGPSGTVVFSDGSAQIGTATVAPFGAFFCAPSVLACAGGTATLSVSFGSTGSHSITAAYSGDTNYALSSASAITITVTSPGSFTIGGGNATVTAGASSTSTITLTPTGGFNGSVNVTCPTAGLPPGVTCSPNPLVVTVPTGGANGTGSLMIAVAAPSSALSASAAPAEPTLYAAGTIPPRSGKVWWTLSAGTGLAALFLLLLPGRKRYRAALGLGLICVLSFALGCNGGGYSPPPPAATTTKITVTSTKVASGTNIAFSITVTPSGTATVNGSVQLFEGATALGGAVTLSGGSASINNASFVPGVHPISAKYTSSDTSTLASASGTLNIAITGTTTFAVTATPAASNGSLTVNLTIN